MINTPKKVCPNPNCNQGMPFPILRQSQYKWATYHCYLCKKYYDSDLNEVFQPDNEPDKTWPDPGNYGGFPIGGV